MTNIVPLKPHLLAVHLHNAEPQSALAGHPRGRRGIGISGCALLLFALFVGWALIYVAAQELIWWLK